MSSILLASAIFAALVLAILFGRLLTRLLPQHHLSADTKDSVKLAMGLVATMTALLLGLLVSSAKGAYDTTRGEINQMAAKIALLDRGLTLYGPDGTECRALLCASVDAAVQQIWPDSGKAAADSSGGDAAFNAIGRLAPKDDAQRSIKAQAMSAAIDLGQLRALLDAQSSPSISYPMLIIVVSWLAIIFASFSMLAPRNATAIVASLVSALSVSGALYLILELDRPFSGLLRISSDPIVRALNHLAKGAP